jgi:hypothetical protein
MKLHSKTILFTVWLLSLALGLAFGRAWAGETGLFSPVASEDATYPQLQRLARAGLLPENEVTPPLTRYEVAKLIFKARKNFSEIRLAQAGKDSDDTLIETTQETTGTLETGEQAVENLEETAKSLNSLEDAYQHELKAIQDGKKSLGDRLEQAETDQSDIAKRLKGFKERRSVSIHGLGRAWGLSRQYSNIPPSVVMDFSTQTTREARGFLDLVPMGVISKEIRWEAMFRLGGAFTSDNAAYSTTLRRIEASFVPGVFSLDLGDFYESYSPLTLWNRNSLDLKFKPEMWARQDEYLKYESLLQRSPEWPLRGVRAGANLEFPHSDVLDRWNTSVFAHMIRNGFDDNAGSYFGSSNFTDWVFAGRTSFKFKKGYIGGLVERFSLDAFGIILDQPLYTNAPGSSYDPTNTATWAHQYLVGCVNPRLEVGLGGGLSVGAQWEAAVSSYQDDKRNGDFVPVRDIAEFGGLYVKLEESTLALNYLWVGPQYYSPLAQARQDAVNPIVTLGTIYLNSLVSPELFQNPLRSQFFLSALTRPSGFFGFYDRTQDNTFPYGLATPNRQGIGMDLDVKALQQKSLKILGSAYLACETAGNLVMNRTATAFVPLEVPAGTEAPIRDFIYINVGPSFNAAPSLGLGEDLEIGGNARYEDTRSSIGELESLWLLWSLRAGILKGWEVTVAYSQQWLKGTEAGWNGAPLARYSYLFDNTDLGLYTPFSADGTVESLRFSSSLRVSPGSCFYLDFDLTWGNYLAASGNLGNTLHNEYGRLIYEVEF